jgi:hypothetical protein
VDVVQHKAAIERAVGENTLVCDTMEVARYVCYNYKKGQDSEMKGLYTYVERCSC